MRCRAAVHLREFESEEAECGALGVPSLCAGFRTAAAALALATLSHLSVVVDRLPRLKESCAALMTK